MFHFSQQWSNKFLLIIASEAEMRKSIYRVTTIKNNQIWKKKCMMEILVRQVCESEISPFSKWEVIWN